MCFWDYHWILAVIRQISTIQAAVDSYYLIVVQKWIELAQIAPDWFSIS